VPPRKASASLKEQFRASRTRSITSPLTSGQTQHLNEPLSGQIETEGVRSPWAWFSGLRQRMRPWWTGIPKSRSTSRMGWAAFTAPMSALAMP
jgi:hypothetical protein